MSLALALNTALSGLNVNQRALAVLSQNIANANTAGYSRKVLNQQSLYLDGNGVGATIESITRKVDEDMIQNIRLQSSIVGRADAASDYASRTQLFLGTPGVGNNVSSYTTQFFSALRSLSQTPEDGTLRNNTVNNAITLTQQINQLANNLQGLRFQADQDLNTAITVINSDLKQVFALNNSISQNLSQGRSIGELQDQRDKLVADISQYLDLQTFTRESGAVNLSCNGVSLLDDGLFQLSYVAVTSADQLASNLALSPVQVYRSDTEGNLTGNPATLITGGTSDQVVSAVASGRIKALLDQRDRQLPNMLAQLDLYAATLRDRFNAVHNAGTAFPGANSYTGTRAVLGDSSSLWTGKMRLAVLGPGGKPIASAYSNMPNGMPPLTLDLGSLNTGGGAGRPSVQGIINEINQYFGAPQNKVKVGNLNNIQLASLVSSLPGTPPQFSFDLDLENLSGTTSNVFVTGVSVLDNTSAAMTVTSSPSSIAIAGANGFVTVDGSKTVTINTSSAHGLENGSRIYLPDIAAAISPATDLNGIPLSELSDKAFTVSNVSSTSFTITVDTEATADGAVASTGAVLWGSYGEMAAGESGRQGDPITASLSLNSASPYYTVSVTVAVDDGAGNIRQSVITYQVTNSQPNLLNDRYAARSATGDGTLIAPSGTQSIARAVLVDADGNELPKINGEYITTESGFLKIIADNSSYAIAIDSLDSSEGGDPDGNPPIVATSRGFSYYFNLNDFFVSAGDDAVSGSAAGLKVAARLVNDPSLISLGTLQAVSSDGVGSGYTYQRTIGDNRLIQQLADLGANTVAFAATGGLGATSQTFSGYAGQIIAAASLSAASTKTDTASAQALLDGYVQQNSAISGVNLDEELANTIVYQNAYAASARVITVANTLFDALLNSFSG